MVESEMLGKIARKETIGIALSAVCNREETIQVLRLGFTAMRAYSDRIKT
jgi:hypothetical protein